MTLKVHAVAANAAYKCVAKSGQYTSSADQVADVTITMFGKLRSYEEEPLE